MKIYAALLAGVWLFQVLASGGGAEGTDRFGWFRWLTLKPSAVIDGLQLWRVVSFGFLGEPGDVVAIVLQVMLVLIFGSAFEERVGRNKALAAIVGANAFGALVVLAVSRFDLRLLHAQVVGPAAAVSALAVAWGVQRADERLNFLGALEMRGKHFAMLTAGLTILSFVTGRSGSHLSSVAGLVAGVFIARIGPPPTSSRKPRGTGPNLRLVRDDPKRWLN
jgi:membrane associated rhomboid family serine protease